MARVISAGIQSIIEDLYGRTGYKDVGISHSGFMDHYTARLLNKVLGNDLKEAGIEIAGGGFALEFEEESVIAYGGSTIEGYVNDIQIPPYEAVHVEAGDVFRTGKMLPTTRGFRTYLMMAGGMDAQEYLGSKATAVYGSFGGFDGRKLKKGDQLAPGAVTDKNHDSIGYRIKSEYIPEMTDTWEFHAMPGPDAAPDFITDEGMEQIYQSEYKAQMFCDRAGIRLKGPKPIWNPDRAAAGGHPSNITDHGYPGPGGINVSGDTLIMFPVEAPTCGGLICAISVVYADVWKMGQIFPGRDKIRFIYATQEDANELRRRQNLIFEGDGCIERK